MTPLAFWPFADVLPEMALYRADFTHDEDADADFLRLGLPLPDSLKTAASKRKREFLAGRCCAASALQQLSGQHLYPERAADAAPQWPAGWCGSISHSHGMAAAVVGSNARWHALGLDIERWISTERAARVAKNVWVEEERAQASRLSPEAAARYLTLCFSAKESLFKALYPTVQRRFYFSAAAVVNWQETGRFCLQLREELAPTATLGQCFEGFFTDWNGYLFTLIAVAKP